MSALTRPSSNEFHSAGTDSSWNRLCQLGGASALMLLTILAAGLVAILFTFVAGFAADIQNKKKGE